MKRSEMLEKLENLLQTIPVSDNGSYYQDAETILDFLEKEGMFPPGLEYDGFGQDNITRLRCGWDKE